jgi:hypothetical protein
MRGPKFDGVNIYVWDSHKKRECMVPLLVLDDVIGQHAALDAFPEGKAYFALEVQRVFDRAT